VVTNLGGTVNIPEDLRHVVAAKTLGAEDTNAGTLAVRYTGVNHLTVDYKFDYTHEDYTQLPYYIIGFSSFAPFIGPFGAFGYKLAPTSASSAFPGYSDHEPAGMGAWSNVVTMGHNLTAAYEINPNLTVKNILGYRTERQVQFLDNDGSNLMVTTPTSGGQPVPFVLSDTVAAHSENQVSDEFQVLGKVAHFEWIVGAFYFNEHSFDQPVNLAFATLGSATNRTYTDVASDYGATSPYGHSQTESEAVYAHFTDHITDRLDLSGGLRYSQDDKSEQLLGSCYFPSAAAGDPIAPLTNVPENVSYCIKTKTTTLANGTVITRSSSAEKNFSSTDWDLSLIYQIAPDVKAYVRGATGYESGGFINFYTYLPEKDTSYEVGLKSEFLDRRVLINADAYTTRRDDAQQPRYYGTNVGSHIDNVTIDERGFELESQVLPMRGMTLSGSVGYADSHAYDGTRQATPKWNVSLTGQYNFPRFNDGMYVSIRSDAIWVDKILPLVPIVTYPGTTSYLGGTNDQAGTIPAQWTVNANVSLLNIPINGYQGHLNLWAKNLFDDHHTNAVSDFVTVVLANWKPPRTIGLDFGVNF
jgi:iron complex outermembrane recepter protein